MRFIAYFKASKFNDQDFNFKTLYYNRAIKNNDNYDIRLEFYSGIGDALVTKDVIKDFIKEAIRNKTPLPIGDIFIINKENVEFKIININDSILNEWKKKVTFE